MGTETQRVRSSHELVWELQRGLPKFPPQRYTLRRDTPRANMWRAVIVAVTRQEAMM